MLSTPRAVSRNFNPSLESFLASHGSETLLRNGVAAEDFVCTHTAFNGRPAGGNFQILHEDRDLFLRLYLQRLSVKDSGPFASTPLYLNERVIKGRPFRYYVDVDMSDATADVLFAAVADGHPLKLYRMLSDTFRRVIGDVTGEEVQECHFSRRRRGKLHFQFPTVIVDGPTAASFVAIARDSLKQLHPEFLPTQWDSIFDVGVYKSGLRMIGSRKFGHHADEDEPVYRLYDLSSGEEVPLTLEILERCMIQPHPDKDFEAVERMMESMTLEGYSSGVTLTRSVASGVRATAGIADETLERLFSYLSELRNDPKFSGRPLAAQKITRMSETIAGDGSARKRMKTSASTSSEQHAEHGFFVLLADRICPNAKREHRRKSAYLYLTVARTGTQMRCHNEECRGYAFPDAPVPLNASLKDVLGVIDDGAVPTKRPGKPRKKRLFGEDESEEEAEARTERMLDEIKRFGLRFDFDASGEDDDDGGECLDSLMLTSLNKTHFDVAKVVFYVLRDVFRADGANDSKTVWYRFDGNRWQTKGATLKLVLSTYIPFIYTMWRQRRMDMLDQTLETWDADEKMAYESLQLSLKQHSFKNAVASECALLFAAAFPDFTELLDSNPKLLVCQNGVLDFTGERGFLRRGAASDNCSFSTNINYDASLNWDSPAVKAVLGFFKDLFPEEDTLRFALDVFSRCLIGRTEELFFLLSGSGSNGKSKLVKLISSCLGDYSAEIPVALLTGKRNKSSAASPEIMHMRGRRFVTTSEPDSGESESVLNMGIIKLLTGGDQVSARNLFQNQQEFTPMASLFLCTNDCPKFSDGSLGTWRRVRFIEMVSRFTKEPKHSYDKLIDPELDDKLAGWREAALWIFVQTLNTQLGKLLEDCESVLRCSAEIRKESDHLQVFLDRHITSAPEYILDLDVALEQYQDFCALENVKHNRPHAVKRRLRENFGEPKYGGEDGEKLFYKARLKISVSAHALNKTRLNR